MTYVKFFHHLPISRIPPGTSPLAARRRSPSATWKSPTRWRSSRAGRSGWAPQTSPLKASGGPSSWQCKIFFLLLLIMIRGGRGIFVSTVLLYDTGQATSSTHSVASALTDPTSRESTGIGAKNIHCSFLRE